MDEGELKEIAEQLAHPRGEMGRRIAESMNQSNAELTRETIRALTPRPGETIVEIGAGNGLLSLPLIETLGPTGRYVDVDRSKEMLESARANLSREGAPALEFHHGEAVSLSLGSLRADALMAVNVLYFIPDLDVFFSAVAGWLGPAGRLAFGVRSKKALEILPFVKYGFKARPEEDVAEALERAGFEVSYRYFEEEAVLRTMNNVPTVFESVVFSAVRAGR